jgi:5-oxopent-3-ene-1,2,5-tricarboxylate decarboxylase/2-hydroxyhepta-2,4-diene-1,7-dioate isomerase
MSAACLAFDFAPYRLSGVVYGVLLNHQPALAALGEQVHAAPYKAPPQAPVLYVKPRNTLAGHGDVVRVPATAGEPGELAELEVGAALGLVIGRTACRVSAAEALDYVAGLTIVADISVPHASFYRPSLRQKVRDGFCPIGPQVTALAALAEPAALDRLAVKVWVDGALVHETTTGERLRSAARLLADVTEFMTLQPGDVLMLGVSHGAPRVRAGQTVAIEIEGLGRLENRFEAEGAAAAPAAPDPAQMAAPAAAARPTGRHARVAFGGAIHTATPHDGPAGAALLRLDDGRVVPESAVQWLVPFEPGTVLALGLNYADHVKELAKELTVTAKDEPLVFLKGPGALIGHRAQTRRPAGVQFMHYECELAVVIGRPARNVRRADAMDFVAGYTVANDYAIRDYLENWYRPNLRVKNRDTGTVLGPWFVPAAEVADPHALGLRTFVNGALRQQGSTAHMVNDIPALIEYLSSFMTLLPGDVILTGTPDGVVNVNVGDEVVTEIDCLGRLVNTLVGDDVFGR